MGPVLAGGAFPPSAVVERRVFGESGTLRAATIDTHTHTHDLGVPFQVDGKMLGTSSERGQFPDQVVGGGEEGRVACVQGDHAFERSASVEPFLFLGCETLVL